VLNFAANQIFFMTTIKESNHHFSFKISINAPKEKVWMTLIDVPTWSIWDTELISAELNGPFELGAKGKLKPKTGPELDFFITELTAFKSYTIKTKMPIGWLEINRTLLEEGQSVIFNDDIQFTGVLKRFFGLLLGGGFRKVLPQVLNNFKERVEQVNTQV
jgi:carbon monoxide dehydrogenase subunit G